MSGGSPANGRLAYANRSPRRLFQPKRMPMRKPKDNPPAGLREGARCKAVGGTHAGRSGVVADIRLSKTGFTTITVVQSDGERFKTLAKNVVVP